MQRVDDDGKLISADGEHIDKDGRLIEWQEDGTSVYVDGKGTKLTEDGEYDIDFSPFLDDSGDPIETPAKEDEEATAEEEVEEEEEEEEEDEEVAEEVAEKVAAPKKRGRPKKQKVEDSTE